MAFDIGSLASISPFSGSGTFSFPSSATSALSDRSPIHIAPVGVNFGAMLQPYAQGSPENGGVGADFMARYAGGSLQNRSSGDIRNSNLLPWLVAGGAGLIALMFLMR